MKTFYTTLLLIFALLSLTTCEKDHGEEFDNFSFKNSNNVLITTSSYSTLSKDFKWLSDVIEETRLSDPRKALFYSTQLIETSQRLGDKNAEGLGYYQAAYIYEQDLVMYINSLTNYFTALNIYNDIGNVKSMSSCFVRIGSIYYKVGLYDDALKYYQLYLECAKKTSNKEDEAEAYRAIALVYRELNNGESISYLQKAVVIYEALGNKSEMATCYNSLGSTYYAEKKYNEAKEYYLKTLAIREQTKDNALAEVYFNLGLLYEKLNDSKTSLDYLDRCLQISEEINYLIGIINADFEIANTYYNQKAYQQSISELNKALIVAEQFQDKSLLINITQLFSDSYHAIGDKSKAKEYEDRNTDLKEDYRLDQMKAIQLQNQQRNEVQRFNQGSLLVKESPEKMLWLIGIVVALISGAGVTLLGIKRKVKIVETPMIKLRKPELADLSWWHTTQFQWIKDEVELTKKIIEGLENIIQGSSDEPTREVVQLIIEELKEKLKTIHYLASFTDDVNPKEPPTAPNG